MCFKVQYLVDSCMCSYAVLIGGVIIVLFFLVDDDVVNVCTSVIRDHINSRSRLETKMSRLIIS